MGGHRAERARTGKSSPVDQAAAAALYEQLAFPDPADDDQEDQEQKMVLSPERLAWLQELQRRVGERAWEAPKAKANKRRGGSTSAPSRRPGYRPHR